jgi:LPS sulfotransferase NodH
MTDTAAATRFVILNAARTGSNYLCALLNSHPEILCHHEIFNPHVVGVARDLHNGGFALGTIEERERDPIAFLERVWRTALGYPIVGFKLCWRQHEVAYRAVLADTSVRKIVLKRRNRVRTFVSLLRARQTGEWVIYADTGAAPGEAAIRVEYPELLHNIDYNEQYYAEVESTLAATGQQHLTLFYEELTAEPALARLLEFLGAARPDPALLQSGTRKLITSRSLREVVSNFDELHAAVAGTALEAELHAADL